MIDILKVAAIQYNIAWHDKNANKKKLEDIFQNVKKDTDLVVLPEMFTTGFSMDSSPLSETMQGESLQWMTEKAKSMNTMLIGSLIIEDTGKYYNRLFCVFPDGGFQYYDKRHLFRMAGENKHYSAGSKKLVIEYKGWKICPLICYDLRFPVWSRNQDDYDLLIYIANWPAKRRDAWNTLLLARAIENQTYCIGVNRIGKDDNGIDYSGDSAIIDASGKAITHAKDREGIISSTLSIDKLNRFRNSFPVHRDKDKFKIITD